MQQSNSQCAIEMMLISTKKWFITHEMHEKTTVGKCKKIRWKGKWKCQSEKTKKNFRNDDRNWKGKTPTPLPLCCTHLSMHLFDWDVKTKCYHNFESSHHLVTPNKRPFKLSYIGKFEPTLPRFFFGELSPNWNLKFFEKFLN